jgi:hypothetical protein
MNTNAKLSVRITQFFSFCVLLAGMSGCVKYYDLVPSEFPQAKKKKESLKQVTYAIRDVQFYKQFSTEAIFNILWKSPRVNSIILDMYANRRGLSADKKNAIRAKNQASHDKEVTFFVLAYVKDTQRPDLNDPDSTWKMYLKTDNGHRIAATKVKMMDMTPELAEIFGKRNTNFKQLYLVTFPRKYMLNDENQVVMKQKEVASVAAQKTPALETGDMQVVEPVATTPSPENDVLLPVETPKPEPVFYDLMDQDRIKMIINSVTLKEGVSWPVTQHLVEDSEGEPLYMENESNNDEDCDWL